MRKPRALGSGALGIFAPSSPFDPERFERGRSILESLGYRTKVHPFAVTRTGYLAGTEAERRRALVELLEDPDVGALIAARGGYGATRLLEGWEGTQLAATEKAIVGFSDVTALHAARFRAGFMSIHGPVVTQLGDLGERDHEVFARVLAGDWEGLEYAADGLAISPGVARGRLFGGCLSVLAAMFGTGLLSFDEDVILMLEDVSEAPYRIDRMLTQLRMTGLLARVRGIAVGDFVNCQIQREGEPSAEEVLRERLGDLGVPVLAGLPFGHGRRNLAVPLGAQVILDADAGTLRLER